MSNNTTNNRRGLKSFWTVGAIVAVATIVVIFIWLKVGRGGEEEEDGPGWDLYGYDDDAALESYSLECAFGPEE